MAVASQSIASKCLVAARNFAGTGAMILGPILLVGFLVVRLVEIQSMDSDLLYTSSTILSVCHAVGEHSSVGKALNNYAHPAVPAKKASSSDDSDDMDMNGPMDPVSYISTMGFDADDDDTPPDNTLYTRLVNPDGSTAALSPATRPVPAVTAALTALHPQNLPDGWIGFTSGPRSPELRVIVVSLHQYKLECARQWVEPAAFLWLIAKALLGVFAAGVAMSGALGYVVTAGALRPIGTVIDVEAKRREVVAAEKLAVDNTKVLKRTLVEQPSIEEKRTAQPTPEPVHRVLIDQPEEEQQQQVIGRTPPDI